MTFSFEKERLTAVSPEGIPMGYITFPRIRPGLVNINHMTVFSPFRGTGVETGMMEALLEHLSERNEQAALSVPFAQQYVSRNTHWKHILPDCIHFTKH